MYDEQSARDRVLFRVLPVGEEVLVHGGRRNTLTSVELWSFGIVLRWVGDAPSFEESVPDGPDAPTAWDWQVTDDLGNEYQSSGGAAGGPLLAMGNAMFFPAVDPAARLLRIFVPLAEREVPLEVDLA